MTTSGSYDVHASHRNVNAEIERLAAQARLGWGEEARTLARFGLRDGMSLLELGSGPGFITEQLQRLLPASPITCLELDPTLLEQARQYLHTATHPTHFVQGSVMDIQLADNTFDFAYARLLFQHLPNPLAAAKEICRVLRPGGRLVIYDIDDDLFGLIDPPIPEWSAILEKYGQAQATQGGNRRVGRNLWRILKAAGFVQLNLEVVATHSDAIGIEPFLPQTDPDRLLPLVKMGLIAESELEAIRASRERFLASPAPYILMLSLMVGGEKPQ